MSAAYAFFFLRRLFNHEEKKKTNTSNAFMRIMSFANDKDPAAWSELSSARREELLRALHYPGSDTPRMRQ